LLTRNKIKLLRSLKEKKERDRSGLFVAEGDKLVREILVSKLTTIEIIAEKNWVEKNEGLLNCCQTVTSVGLSELGQASFLKTPPEVIALVQIPKSENAVNSINKELSLFLDDIQDPGNLGTIMRLADWFGISNIYCSKATVDVYNPKVVQATMGAICRVNVQYVDKISFLGNIKQEVPGLNIYGTFLNGINIYTEEFEPNGLIILGNEGNGISTVLEPYISKRLYIPAFSSEGAGSESLNVSVAAAIVCSEFRRRGL
jgi:RNA methyltransferase, TrmH family